MCWVCEHPESSSEERLEYVRGLIVQNCWVVIGVHEELHRPPYSYTVGLTEQGRPELVITGLPQKRAADVLSSAAAEVLDGATLTPGKHVRVAGGPMVEVVQLTQPGAHLDIAAALYERRLEAVQLVYADRRGYLPWDRRFRNGRGGQPVLGMRAEQAA